MPFPWRQRVIALGVLPFALATVLVLASASPASAHEHRHIGDYEATVGWGGEPAYAGFQNSVQLVLTDHANNPVLDLGDTLKVTVTTGDQTIDLALVPNFEVGEFGEPGDYRAWIIPTRPGTYSFHFTGTIKGQTVDETFTSSDTTFDDIADPTEVQFPAKDPTAGELADRIDRETARANDANAAATAEAKTAKDDAATGRTIGIVGIVVAVAALGLGAFALRRRPSA